MKKIIVQLVLLVIIVVLGYYVYQSVLEPIEFRNEQRKRELVVINKLKDIRNSQLVFRQLKGSYSNNFDSLIAFLSVAEIPIVKMVPDPEDTTFTRTINDTIGYIKAADTLFQNKAYSINELGIIPFSSNILFDIDADTIDRGGVEVHVFEIKAPIEAYLAGMDRQTIINIVAKQKDIERYPGLKVGSMTEPSTDGNWE